jgi:transcriptional regulator of acetoin/glycerol metabolism
MERTNRSAESTPSPAINGNHLGLAADPADISRSWQRCRQAGLMPERTKSEAPHMSGGELRIAAQRRTALINHARPVIEYLYGQIRDSGCVMLLSDEKGFLLDALGDTEFCHRAARVALEPGACWAEDARGTNAVGTALIEAKPIVVYGTQHYLRHNGFLACAAAPLAAPNGELLGVIDISCDSRLYHPHTFGLVRAAAQMIENRIFELSFRKDTKVRFQLTGAAGLYEGAFAVSEDERVIGMNRAGFDLLGIGRDRIGHIRLEELFEDTSLGALAQLDRQAQGRPIMLRQPGGGALTVSLERPSPALVRGGAPPQAARHDALRALDTGDAGIAASIKQLRRVLDRPIAILLQGETGAGKDYFARAIHAVSSRGARPFVALNCAALPESLSESEVFGHAPGAFNGARREGAIGKIREADGGTLFLDEIGDMPVQMQTRLLRVLEDRHVTPLGGKPVAVDFRLISATHCDFKARIAAQQFRADLFYRLNGLTITLPPLRERADQTVLIGNILAAESRGRAPDEDVRLSPSLAEAFGRFAWPGNLRQLSGVLRTACSMLDDDEYVIDWHHLSRETAAELAAGPQPAAGASGATLREHSDAVIADTITQLHGNMTAAARRLGVSRNTLYRRMSTIQ